MVEGGSAPAVREMPSWQLARRARILDAAAAALDEQDYEQIQMRDVAQAAGVALGTLYRYFSSKEHLYAAVLEQWAGAGEAYDARHAELDVEQRVRARIRRVVRAFERRPRYYRLQVLLLGSADAGTREVLLRVTETATARLVDDLAVLGRAEAQDVATMVWSIISSMVASAVHSDRPMGDVYRVCDAFVDLLVPRLQAAQMQAAQLQDGPD